MTQHPLLTTIDTFTQRWPHAEFGPGHIVLSDYNLLNQHIQYCLDQIAAGNVDESPPDEVNAVVAFLQELLMIPEADRWAIMLLDSPDCADWMHGPA